jgi:hypothetical protein
MKMGAARSSQMSILTRPSWRHNSLNLYKEDLRNVMGVVPPVLELTFVIQSQAGSISGLCQKE